MTNLADFTFTLPGMEILPPPHLLNIASSMAWSLRRRRLPNRGLNLHMLSKQIKLNPRNKN